MAINVSQAFHRTSANPIDDTLALTKAEMLTVNDNLMPAKYITICQDDGQIYLYDKTNTADPTTGKFRVFEGGGGSDIQVDTLPTASADELGNIYQYVGVTDTDYTNGCFYECVSDGQSTPTYSWEMKPVMPSLEASDMADIVTPLPTGGRVTGFTPIGTIIPMIAETAPLYYLKCDGATYNKSDYPELAAHLLSMTNHSMYEVSGDNTKFKVPDLRGEFLRGTGTNGHANQGNGSAVGVHQNGTEFNQGYLDKAQNRLDIYGDENSNLTPRNRDRDIIGTGKYCYSSVNWATYGTNAYYTARPTNTSVLYCIATKDIYIDARNIYSTTEKVVGEWIDGKPIYQITLSGTISVVTDGEYKNTNVDVSALNIETLVNREGFMRTSSGNYYTGLPYTVNNYSVDAYYNGDIDSIDIQCNRLSYNGRSVYVTIQYTKTTD